MLISDKLGPVDSTYKPGLGEEVYNTVTQATYRGDGMTALSSLSPVGPEAVEPQDTFFLGANAFLGATALSATDEPYIVGLEYAEDAVTSVQTSGFNLPVGWNTFALQVVLMTDPLATEAAVTRWGVDFQVYNLADGDYDQTLSAVLDATTPATGSTTFLLESGGLVAVDLYDAYESYDFLTLVVHRYGTNPADVGTQSVYLLGVLFTKVS